MHPKVALIGDVFVDVMFTRPNDPQKLRLGGIMHAARTLWALDIVYDFLYIAPQYLYTGIEDYAHAHGANSIQNIGCITGSSNTVLIEEPQEAGAQGYDILLRDEYKAYIDTDKLSQALNDKSITDILIFPGDYDLGKIINACKSYKAKVHIDIAYGINSLNILGLLGRKFDTVITSSSSSFFTDQCKKSVTLLKENLPVEYFKHFLFKENRGGARLFNASSADKPIKVGAQVRPIAHSVGVGDCFNAAYIGLSHKYRAKTALTYASWIAGEYASTTYPDDFKLKCRKVMALHPSDIMGKLKGVSVSWEARPCFNVYLAAPDFDHIDRTAIEKIKSSLEYHNFTPRLPVRENGQLEPNASFQKKQLIYNADINLLLECQVVLAVMINDDPGTIFEIGYAIGIGKPVIIYDPKCMVRNPMLSQSASLVTADLDQIIGKVFELASKR